MNEPYVVWHREQLLSWMTGVPMSEEVRVESEDEDREDMLLGPWAAVDCNCISFDTSMWCLDGGEEGGSWAGRAARNGLVGSGRMSEDKLGETVGEWVDGWSAGWYVK